MTGSFLLIGKNGEVSDINVRNTDISSVYKKLLAKTPTEVSLHVEWDVKINNKKYKIGVYGKIVGRAGQENKYEFPPPIDNTLFFGKVAVVSLVDGAIGKLTESEWDKIYDHLHGGFDDIGDDDDEEEDDEDETVPRTKSGYVRDDFVVDDDEQTTVGEEEEEEDEFEDDDEETTTDEDIAIAVPVIKTRSSKRVGSKGLKKAKPEPVENKWIDDYECTDELSEEEYV